MSATNTSKYAGHTSGEWRSFHYDNGLREIGTATRKVAEMRWTIAPSVQQREDEANALLLADAPKLLAERDALLEACKEAVKLHDGYEWIDKVRAAIALVEANHE